MDGAGFSAIFGMVVGGLMVAAISGNVVMYRQVGVLNQAVIDLTKALDGFVRRSEFDQIEASSHRRGIHVKLNELEKQVLDVQARVGRLKDRGPEKEGS